MKKTAWISGEVCKIAGRYVSESCNHELERAFIVHDIFPHCPQCQKTVRWTFSGAPKSASFTPAAAAEAP